MQNLLTVHYTLVIFLKKISITLKSSLIIYLIILIFYIQDSLIFLNEFTYQIDLLYLDSLDSHDPIAASNHQLKEAKISIKKIS